MEITRVKIFSGFIDLKDTGGKTLHIAVGGCFAFITKEGGLITGEAVDIITQVKNGGLTGMIDVATENKERVGIDLADVISVKELDCCGPI